MNNHYKFISLFLVLLIMFCIFIYDILYGDVKNAEVMFSNNIIITSNEYVGFKRSKYPMYYAFDGNINTAWVFNKMKIKPVISITIPITIYVKSIGLINGYSKSKDLYYANNIIENIKVITMDGEENFNLNSNFKMQYINLKKSTTGKIKIILYNIKLGKKYNDTCISEIELISDKKNSIIKKNFIFSTGGEYPDYELYKNNHLIYLFPEYTLRGFFIYDGKYAVFEHASGMGKNGITIVNMNTVVKKDYFEKYFNIPGTLNFQNGYFLFKSYDTKNNMRREHKSKIILP